MSKKAITRLEELLQNCENISFHKIDNMENTYKIEGLPVFVQLDEKENFKFTKISDNDRKEVMILDKDITDEKFQKAANFWDPDSISNADYADPTLLVKEILKGTNFKIDEINTPDGEISKAENIHASSNKAEIKLEKVADEYIFGYKNSHGFEKNYAIDTKDNYVLIKLENIFKLERLCDGLEVHAGKSEYELSDNLEDYPNVSDSKMFKTNNGYLVEKKLEDGTTSTKSFVNVESALFHIGAIDRNAYISKILDKAEETKIFVETSYLYKQYKDIKDWVVEKPDALNELLAELDKANKILDSYKTIVDLEAEKDGLIVSEKYETMAVELTTLDGIKNMSEEEKREIISKIVDSPEDVDKVLEAYKELLNDRKELENTISSSKERLILAEVLGESKNLETKEVVIRKDENGNFEVNLIAADVSGKEYILTPIERSGIIQISESRDLEGLHYKLTPETIEVENHELLDTVIVRNFMDENGKPEIEFASKTLTVRQSDRTIEWSSEIEECLKDAEKVYDGLDIKDTVENPDVVENTTPVVEEVKETVVVKETEEVKGLTDFRTPTPQEVEEEIQAAEALNEAGGFEEPIEYESEMLDNDMDDDYFDGSYIPDDDNFDSVE